MKKSVQYLLAKKKKHRPITMLTAYDFPAARIEDRAGVDVVLVGDSVGTNVLGYSSEREVTMADMVHHAAAVARGVSSAYLMADLPFASCTTPARALKNARLLLATGIDCVKLEGWKELCPTVRRLSQQGIAVCAHIGYNPQVHGSVPRTFGKHAEEALLLVESACALEKAGAVMIVLEKVPAQVAGVITRKLGIPTIGIGSGRECDGQVLVINDILGMDERTFKHARRYMDFYGGAQKSVMRYVRDVEGKRFPGKGNFVNIDDAEFIKVKKSLL